MHCGSNTNVSEQPTASFVRVGDSESRFLLNVKSVSTRLLGITTLIVSIKNI
jgi:hypothetical protein